MLRSCDPVWEQGFTFLVSNPETGILHIKVIRIFKSCFIYQIFILNIYINFQITDEKTNLIVGEMNYNISLLLTQNNLEISQQPYDLQMAEVDSKLILSMSLSV